MLEQLLNGINVPLGTRAPNGVFVTDDMLDGAGIMVDDIEQMLQPYGVKATEGAIEVSVSIPRTHELCHGTPDYRIWLRPLTPAARWTLLLYDFKFGYRVVDVFENWQLMDYVSGCISGTKLHDLDVDVICKIVQPRAYHPQGPVREWRFNAAHIRQFVNIRAMKAEEALGPNPGAATGPHCGDCHARHACSLFQRSIYAAIDYSGKAVALDMTPAAMGLELALVDAAIKRLEARKSGLDEQVLATLRSGGRVPGWLAEFGTGREGWKLPDSQVVAIGKALGLDVAKPIAALTPKQAAKAGMPPEVLNGLIDPPKTALKLTRDDGSAARKVFG